MNKFILLGVISLFLMACTVTQQQGALPILGMKDVSPAGDTLYHTVPDFAFTDQTGQTVSQQTLQGKIYVVDFFFTSCPSICPKMKEQMIRVHEEFLEEDKVILLSHTIDPEHDSVEVLHAYAEALGINSTRWRMLTGDKDQIYTQAEKYLVSVGEDETAPGGFIHGGHFILLDHQHRVRGYYDGTVPEDVDELMRDMHRLLAQEYTSNPS
ncbi:MAG: SCO family protein [Bacteroidota bacterium]